MTVSLLEENLNLLWSSLIVNELVKNGVDTFFVSPGNRNVPLIAALARNSNAVKRLTVDERASAFRALGHTKATGRAGALICTSGTALSNYFPAVIEACEDELPLVIISADRPPELVGSHANQSIEQTGIYGRFALDSLNLPCPDIDYPLDALLAKIDNLLSISSGPVHINCPFREPLLQAEAGIPEIKEAYRSYARQLFNSPHPVTRYMPMASAANDLSSIEASLTEAKRGMVVIGRMAPSVNHADVIPFIEKLGWPVYCDIASGLKGQVPRSLQLPIIDHPEALAIIRQYRPDTILQLGTSLVSKHYYETVLPRLKPFVILVTARSGIRDPAHRVDIKLPLPVDRFIDTCRITPCSQAAATAGAEFLSDIDRLYDHTMKQVPADRMSFPLLSRMILEMIPDGEALFLGNSITIRAADTAPFPAGKQINIISNRGGSGIEGNLATTVGFAETRQQRITAVIGDISLLHDLNSLMLVGNSTTPVILVVPNNRGGKIFDRLPARNHPDILDPYLTTPHTMNFSQATAQFELDHRLVENPQAFEKYYGEALATQDSILIEVAINSEEDLEIFRQMQLQQLRRLT